MPEYIEREAVCGFLNDVAYSVAPDDRAPQEEKLGAKMYWQGIMTALDAVHGYPASDVVPVVRCRECRLKYAKDMDYYCPAKAHAVKPWGYCDEGVRE